MIRLEFTGKRDFEAVLAAEAWLRNLGVSFAPLCGPEPRGLFYGEALIAKWRNLSAGQRAGCDGRMEFPTGSARFGPAVVTLADPRIPGEVNLAAPLNMARLEVLKLAQAELDALGVEREGRGAPHVVADYDCHPAQIIGWYSSYGFADLYVTLPANAKRRLVIAYPESTLRLALEGQIGPETAGKFSIFEGLASLAVAP